MHIPLHCVLDGEPDCNQHHFYLSISDKAAKTIPGEGQLTLHDSRNYCISFLILRNHQLFYLHFVFLKNSFPPPNYISFRFPKPTSLLGSAGPWQRFASLKESRKNNNNLDFFITLT